MHNTSTTFGLVSRCFHWLTAIFIGAAIVLGVVASQASFDTADALTRKAMLFSMHKTVGVTVFWVAVLRILWAISQPRPTLLNAGNRAESTLAEIVHWALYASLVAVPSMGWIAHAASEGFAPIWWPFGQNLPFVPKSPWLSETAGSLHMAWEKILIASIVLHVVGALKHHFWDKDDTLRRMWSGKAAGSEATHPKGWLPPVIAFAAFGALAAVTVNTHWHNGADRTRGQFTSQSQSRSAWQVQKGYIKISVNQFGSIVSGEFQNWSADIIFDPDKLESNGTEKVGSVEVEIDIDSLVLGSVTEQAMGPDYFDANTFQTADVRGDIIVQDGQTFLIGTISIKGIEHPLSATLAFEDDGPKVMVVGKTALKRLDFGIGESLPDGGSLGLSVEVDFSVTAQR